MILHAVSMVAFFVDQVQQAKCIVQCVQAATQDPLLARLLIAALPSVLALGVAWFAFWLNRRWDHNRWLLDQKKAEWRELLDVASDCQIPLHIASTPTDKLAAGEHAIVTDAELKLLKIDQLLDDRIFIDQSILGPLRSKWREAREMASDGSDSSSDEIAGGHTLLLHSIFIKALREAANKDLEIEHG